MTIIDFFVYPRDVDFLGIVKLDRLCNFLVHTAIVDAHNRGFGLFHLREKGLSWVISGIAVDIIRMPNEFETVTVKTWAAKVNRLYTYRHFEVCDEKGEVVVNATSTWSMINFEDRTLARITEHIDCGFVEPIPSTVPPIERIGEFKADLSHKIEVQYSALDTNRHVNSMKYIEWVVDLVELEKIESIKRLDINYLREIKFKDEIVVERAIDENGTMLFSIRGEDSKLACNGLITFRTPL